MTQNSLIPKYNCTDYYAITIQPTDKLQYHGKAPDARILSSRQYYYSLFENCTIPYYINMEISEPLGSLPNKTTGGRLHYHGIIKFSNKNHIIQWLLKYQYKLLREARLEISKITDKKSWFNYISKQNLIPKEIKSLSNWEKSVFITEYLKSV